MSRIGEPFIILPTVDSTNIYAMRQVHARMASHGTAWFALEQTAGKGQRGKSWKSSVGENIILSVVINPYSLALSQIFQLSCVSALACYDLLKKYAGSETSIKWPNDLYWGDRKAGGILIENIVQGSSWKNAVVGIGININQEHFDDNLPNPVSLKQITGMSYNAEQLGRELCENLELRFSQLMAKKFDSLLEEYNSHLFRKDQEVRLKKQEKEFSAVVKKVTQSGNLIVLTNIENEFEFGEVELLR